MYELAFVLLSVLPFVNTISTLHTFDELTLVRLSIGYQKLTITGLQIVPPSSLVVIPVFVIVHSLSPHVISEVPLELVSIEKYQSSFNFVIIFPVSLENCTLREEVFPLALFLPVYKLPDVPVFICILHTSYTIGLVSSELANIQTTVAVQNLPIPFL